MDPFRERQSRKEAPMFVDAAEMKEKLRANMCKPQYDVCDFYFTSGIFQKVARSPIFEKFTLAVIAFNALWISIDTDHNNAEVLLDAAVIFQVAEHGFCFYFSFEWLMRYKSFRRKRDGLKDAWFVFDSCLVFMMVVETWVMTTVMVVSGGGGGGGMGNASILRMARLLRLSRMARMARLLRAMPELLILIKGMVAAVRSVFFTLALLTLMLYIYAIAFRQLTAETEIGFKHFDSVPAAMHTLLLDGAFMDSLGERARQLQDVSLLYLFLFYMFVLMASLTVMNMLIGVLCEVISAVASTEKERLNVAFVKEKLQEIMTQTGLDENGDGQFSKAEFMQILQNQEAEGIDKSWELFTLDRLAETPSHCPATGMVIGECTGDCCGDAQGSGAAGWPTSEEYDWFEEPDPWFNWGLDDAEPPISGLESRNEDPAEPGGTAFRHPDGPDPAPVVLLPTMEGTVEMWRGGLPKHFGRAVGEALTLGAEAEKCWKAFLGNDGTVFSLLSEAATKAKQSLGGLSRAADVLSGAHFTDQGAPPPDDVIDIPVVTVRQAKRAVEELCEDAAERRRIIDVASIEFRRILLRDKLEKTWPRRPAADTAASSEAATPSEAAEAGATPREAAAASTRTRSTARPKRRSRAPARERVPPKKESDEGEGPPTNAAQPSEQREERPRGTSDDSDWRRPEPANNPADACSDEESESAHGAQREHQAAEGATEAAERVSPPAGARRRKPGGPAEGSKLSVAALELLQRADELMAGGEWLASAERLREANQRKLEGPSSPDATFLRPAAKWKARPSRGEKRTGATTAVGGAEGTATGRQGGQPPWKRHAIHLAVTEPVDAGGGGGSKRDDTAGAGSTEAPPKDPPNTPPWRGGEAWQAGRTGRRSKRAGWATWK